jgi:hypothetical protein
MAKSVNALFIHFLEQDMLHRHEDTDPVSTEVVFISAFGQYYRFRTDESQQFLHFWTLHSFSFIF